MAIRTTSASVLATYLPPCILIIWLIQLVKAQLPEIYINKLMSWLALYTIMWIA